MLDAMEAAEAQYDAQKKPGIILLLLESQKPLLTGPKCDSMAGSEYALDWAQQDGLLLVRKLVARE